MKFSFGLAPLPLLFVVGCLDSHEARSAATVKSERPVAVSCPTNESLIRISLEGSEDASLVPEMEVRDPVFKGPSEGENVRLDLCVETETMSATLKQIAFFTGAVEMVLNADNADFVTVNGIAEAAFWDVSKLDVVALKKGRPAFDPGVRIQGHVKRDKGVITAGVFDGTRFVDRTVMWGVQSDKDPFSFNLCPEGTVEAFSLEIATATFAGRRCTWQVAGNSIGFRFLDATVVDDNPELPEARRGVPVALSPEDIAASRVHCTHHNWADSLYLKVSGLEAEYADFQDDAYGSQLPPDFPRYKNAANYSGRGWKEYPLGNGLPRF